MLADSGIQVDSHASKYPKAAGHQGHPVLRTATNAMTVLGLNTAQSSVPTGYTRYSNLWVGSKWMKEQKYSEFIYADWRPFEDLLTFSTHAEALDYVMNGPVAAQPGIHNYGP